MTKSQMQNPLLPFEPRRAKSRLPRLFSRGFTNRDVCVFIGIALLLLSCFSCEHNKTPYSLVQPQIALSVEDVLVTEAWLNVKVEQAKQNRRITLWRDTTKVFSGIIKTNDTTLYEPNLLPNHSYTYRAALLKDKQPFVNSETVQVTTMDTTSHDFTWKIDTIGTTSSVLYDVAIVNENDIWGVGKINASGGPYNAVHWDGQQWELKRILYQGGFWTIRSIYAFGSNNIWLDAIVRWNGSNFIEMPIPGILIGHRINKMWGTSSNDLYVVGSEGLIAHYDGSWQRIESGTDLDFRDIWGAWNNKTGDWQIIAVASKQFVNFNRLILEISDDSQTVLSDNGINWSLDAVWFSPEQQYFVAGAGIYEKGRLSEEKWKNGPLDITHYYTHGIRGNDINDIVAAGGAGEVIHFNGMTWKSFFDVTHLGYGNYYSVAIKNNLVIAVGEDAPRGIIAFGRRISP